MEWFYYEFPLFDLIGQHTINWEVLDNPSLFFEFDFSLIDELWKPSVNSN